MKKKVSVANVIIGVFCLILGVAGIILSLLYSLREEFNVVCYGNARYIFVFGLLLLPAGICSLLNINYKDKYLSVASTILLGISFALPLLLLLGYAPYDECTREVLEVKSTFIAFSSLTFILTIINLISLLIGLKKYKK